MRGTTYSKSPCGICGRRIGNNGAAQAAHQRTHAQHSLLDLKLQTENQRLAERLCRVGSPQGSIGTVEYVYRSRHGKGVLRARVLMEGGSVRHVDLLDMNVW